MKETKKSTAKPGIVKIFKVTLSDRFSRVQGNPFRIIAVPQNVSLYKFAEIILESFHFDVDHCFGFFDNLKNIYDSQEGYELFNDIGEETEYKSVKKTKIENVFKFPGKKMCFMFDYGDDWRFIVEFKNDDTVTNIKSFPKLLESKGKAPEQYPE
jgi:hypothetical protein